MILSSRHPSAVVVIGSGVTGAAVAHRLAVKGVEVILLDSAGPGGGATAASLGGISARTQQPRAYFDLSVAAMEEYRRFAWSLAPAPWYHADGTLVWFTDPAQAAALGEETERLQAWGYIVERLSPARVLADLEPGLSGGTIAAAPSVAWFPQEAWVDGLAMVRRLAGATRNAGGHVLTGAEREVVGIEKGDSGQVFRVTLRGGQTIPVRAVINAAGIAGARIAALLGRHLPVEAPRGLAVIAEMPDQCRPLRRRIHTDLVAVRPDGPGRVRLVPLIDPDELPEGAVPLDHPVVAQVMANGAAAVPALAAAIPVETIAVPWPLLADGLPSVGGVPDIPGYFEAITDYGVTLAPLIARALVDEILGQGANPLLVPFSPARFSTS
jgi:glycine/D-amino acid oxidase-like deaminating enzyme